MQLSELEAPAEDPTGAKEILRRAAAEGLTLALTDDKHGILAGPRDRITTGLREAIRQTRDGLIRELLFREAAEYFQRHSSGIAEGISDLESEDGIRQRETEDERLNEAWLEADLEEFKETLRDWLKYRIRSSGDSRSRENRKDSDVGLQGGHSANEQPALIEINQ